MFWKAAYSSVRKDRLICLNSFLKLSQPCISNPGLKRVSRAKRPHCDLYFISYFNLSRQQSHVTTLPTQGRISEWLIRSLNTRMKLRSSEKASANIRSLARPRQPDQRLHCACSAHQGQYILWNFAITTLVQPSKASSETIVCAQGLVTRTHSLQFFECICGNKLEIKSRGHGLVGPLT